MNSNDLCVRPAHLRAFGRADEAPFCLVTNPSVIGRVRIEAEGRRETRIVAYDGRRAFEDLLREEIPEPAHVLVVSPDLLFVSPDPGLLGRRKLIAMACNSTPTSLAAITHFLAVMETSDPRAEQETADRIFGLIAESGYLEIVDEEYGTRAIFHHRAADHEWNQQAGGLDWGEQQMAPSGELSVLPMGITEYDAECRFAIDGEITLHGRPIVHAGAASYWTLDQQRAFLDLATLEQSPVIARVAGGLVIGLRAVEPASQPAVDMLESMFTVDSRYRVLWEIGIGIHSGLALFPGNAGMNEPFGGDGGSLHFGLGLTPFTQYAPIFLCPGSRMLTAERVEVVGRRKRTPIARAGGPCPCLHEPPAAAIAGPTANGGT
jgi:hypothetical protein